MDPLSDFLDGPRARNAFLLRVTMAPPWAIRVADDAPLTVVAMLTGTAYFLPRGAAPLLLEPGNLLLIRGSSAYVMAHAPDEQPGYFIGVDHDCSGPNGENLAQQLGTGLRSWGNSSAGKDSMLVGTYRGCGQVGDFLLSSLPPHLLVNAVGNPILEVLLQEIHRTGVAQGIVMDRLLDLLLMSAIRAWTDGRSDASQGWLGGERDSVVQEAIKLIHSSPEKPWTVESLAGRVGVSRASLARRFHGRVGRPPMTYLNQWRLAKAADLMGDPQPTLTAISRQVGYASPFSFSAAFKKRYGYSPQEYRLRQLVRTVAEEAPAGL